MDPNKRMPVEELRKTPEFLRLTQKQQLFVATYCAGGMLDGHYDEVQSCRTAYVCKNNETARVMSYALMSNIRIIEALNRHFQTEPIEDLLVALDRAIRSRKTTVAQVNALKLKCDLLGLGNRLPCFKKAMGVIPDDIVEDSRKSKKKKPEPPKPITPAKNAKAPDVKF